MTNASFNNNFLISDFASDDTQAKFKFSEFSNKDPFPEIPAALLNSADIYDYIRVTGMIWPFYPEKLKSASYPIAILGKVVYWDKKGEMKSKELLENDYFTLKSNSIAFVTLQPKFRIPNYIALRFNLKITNVYRGILLGTGPLVDPGFIGKLSIPLHNLTSNDYLFKGGEDLIWMEFTKLSGNHEWDKNISKNDINTNYQKGEYCPFPSDKTEDNLPDVLAYLRKAEPHRPIRSSIPQVFQDAEKAAEKANESVKFFQKLITIGGSISGLIIFLTFGALFFQINSLVQDSVNYVKNSQAELEKKILMNPKPKPSSSPTPLQDDTKDFKEKRLDNITSFSLFLTICSGFWIACLSTKINDLEKEINRKK